MHSIAEVLAGQCDSSEAEVRGWIHRTRHSGGLVFIQLRDSSGIIQVIVEEAKIGAERFADAVKAAVESSLVVKGQVRVDKRAPGGRELNASSLEVVGFSVEFPIQKDQSQELLLDNRHLWLRSRHLTAALKVRSTVAGAIHQFFRERGYYEFDPPIFTPNACEGGATLFEVKYFDRKTYLSQSWQLYAEAAVFALEKVYDFSPTFRAEGSKTSRHLTEFWMAEMEAAWMHLPEATEVAKDEIRFIVKQVIEKNRPELELHKVDIPKLEAMCAKPWPTITYTKAVRMLNDSGYKFEWGKDLRTNEEAAIAKMFDTPVVVTHYPKEIMAFYKPVEPNPEDDPPGPVARCFDMLAPSGTEIVGGSERDMDMQSLVDALEKEGENVENYKWYLDLRRYGSVPHSGYGVGVERVISWILGLEHIRDAIAFPRTIGRTSP